MKGSIITAYIEVVMPWHKMAPVSPSSQGDKYSTIHRPIPFVRSTDISEEALTPHVNTKPVTSKPVGKFLAIGFHNPCPQFSAVTMRPLSASGISLKTERCTKLREFSGGYLRVWFLSCLNLSADRKGQIEGHWKQKQRFVSAHTYLW